MTDFPIYRLVTTEALVKLAEYQYAHYKKQLKEPRQKRPVVIFKVTDCDLNLEEIDRFMRMPPESRMVQDD